MSKKLLLIDKDCTLVKTLWGDGSPRYPWDADVRLRSLPTVSHYSCMGWKIAAISNRPAIGSGKKSLEFCMLEFKYFFALFPSISDAFFCSDYSGQTCYHLWRAAWEVQRDLKDFIRFDHSTYSMVVNTIGGFSLDKFKMPSFGMIQVAMDTFSVARSDVLFVSGYKYASEMCENFGISLMSPERFLHSVKLHPGDSAADDNALVADLLPF